jgi:hypothetical protein
MEEVSTDRHLRTTAGTDYETRKLLPLSLLVGTMRTRKPDYFRMVFDPPWRPGRMSEAAKLQLGLDLDQHSNPVVRISR